MSSAIAYAPQSATPDELPALTLTPQQLARYRALLMAHHERSVEWTDEEVADAVRNIIRLVLYLAHPSAAADDRRQKNAGEV